MAGFMKAKCGCIGFVVKPSDSTEEFVIKMYDCRSDIDDTPDCRYGFHQLEPEMVGSDNNDPRFGTPLNEVQTIRIIEKLGGLVGRGISSNEFFRCLKGQFEGVEHFDKHTRP